MSEERKSEIIIGDKEKLNREAVDSDDENPVESSSLDEKMKREERERTILEIEKNREGLQRQAATNNSDDDQGDDRRDNQKAKAHISQLEKMNIDDQVDYLVKLAVNRSPVLALQIARELENNYLLAEVRNDLTEDEIRQIFIEKGII